MSYAENEKELLRGMAEMFEEFKPFPKDKVNKQIDKKEKRHKDEWDGKANTQAHAMKTVKNFVTKNTDSQKAQQAWTGKDRHRWNDQKNKVGAETHKKKQKWIKAEDKVDATTKKKDKKKAEKKASKKYDKYLSGRDKSASNDALVKHINNSYRDDLDKQAEVNKKDKADRASAKSGMNRAGLENALKAKPKREKMKGPAIKNTIKKEHMNFTEYLDSAVHPLYEKEGEVPKCPPGYRYDVKLVMCVPKTPKDSVGRGERSGDKDLKPGQGAHYNVWGNTGYNGAGYAWEEGPTTNDKASGNYE